MNTIERRQYRLEIDERPGYVYAKVTSFEMTRATALEYLAYVINRCADLMCKRLLIERDIPESTSDNNFIEVTQELVNISRGMRIAFVDAHAGLAEAFRTAIDITKEKGSDFKYFDNAEDAEAWLLGN